MTSAAPGVVRRRVGRVGLRRPVDRRQHRCQQPRTGAGAHQRGGVDAGERYDVIAICGSLPVLQQQFHQNLNIGGRLFVITGTPPVMEALLITRINETSWKRESLFETSLPPLIHASTEQGFVF